MALSIVINNPCPPLDHIAIMKWTTGEEEFSNSSIQHQLNCLIKLLSCCCHFPGIVACPIIIIIMSFNGLKLGDIFLFHIQVVW